jgi:hypothetical protein
MISGLGQKGGRNGGYFPLVISGEGRKKESRIRPAGIGDI